MCYGITLSSKPVLTVHSPKDLSASSSYDSKKETGYVGLKNQGATCYMNSLLQSLFCTHYFRKVRSHLFPWSLPVLKHYRPGCLPNPDGRRTPDRERPTGTSTCILPPTDFRSTRWLVQPLTLTNRITELTLTIQSGTTELTKSFGWKSLDSFLQHDVQEFNRVLQDKLESKMKVCGLILPHFCTK